MPLPTINIPNFAGVSTPVPVANSGRQLAADSSAVASSNEDFAAIGALTETAPVSDTASSGLNGRLQRLAQRLTSLIALFPASLGTKTAANSFAVTLASDGALTTAIGAQADASASSDTGTFSLIALFKRALGYLSTIATNAASTAASPIIMSLTYQAVAVSQTAKVLGVTGAAGDTLQGIIIQPTGTTVGVVNVKDGTTTVYSYPGGTVGADLRPIIVGMGMVCTGAGWHVDTPSNATVLALGKFT